MTESNLTWWLLFVLFLNTCHEATIGWEKKPKVLLVGLDGMRWDFLSNYKQSIPNIASLQSHGVTVSEVENVFPTNTFPNLYSIVTGLYPENHGIIDNQMIDLKNNEKFSMANNETKWWNEAEPIWVTNQKQGHKSGVCYWPGFNVKIGELRPSFSVNDEYYANSTRQDGSKSIMSQKDRMDWAIRWFKKSGVTFVAIYFEQLDILYHEMGTNKDNGWANNISSIIKDLDDAFGYLKKQLEISKLQELVNVIVVGDHGSVPVSNNRIIKLEDIMNIKKFVKKTVGSTFVSIYPKKHQLKDVYNKLHNAHPNMKVYLKSDLPEKFHIKNNKRTAPLMLLADPGWLIDTGFEKKKVYFTASQFDRGEHGYSTDEKNMHPGFFAFGPSFKNGAKFDKIRMVDIYSLMCHIINIKPRSNDGSLDSIKQLLS